MEQSSWPFDLSLVPTTTSTVNLQCSFKETGPNYSLQQWANCRTCFVDEAAGACTHCLRVCHQGHDIGPIQESNFYCDCAANSTKWKCKLFKISLPVTPNVIRSNKGLLNALADIIFMRFTILSPTAIMYMLSMLQLGSAGLTFKELRQLLGVITLKDLEVISDIFSSSGIFMSNMLLVNQRTPLKASYVSKLEGLSRIANVDFSQDADSVANQINTFVAADTNSIICSIVRPDDISEYIKIISLNAVCMCPRWKAGFGFDPSKTYVCPFRDHATEMGYDSDRTVNMMTTQCSVLYGEDSEVQHVQLPVEGNLVFGIILPKNRKIYTCRSHFMAKPTDLTSVDLHLPKFRVDARLDLIQLLSPVGIKDLFNVDRCNLSNMAHRSFVSDQIQMITVEIDETGALAPNTIAITSVATIQMKCDRPFAWYIRHAESGVNVFVGEFR